MLMSCNSDVEVCHADILQREEGTARGKYCKGNTLAKRLLGIHTSAQRVPCEESARKDAEEVPCEEAAC